MTNMTIPCTYQSNIITVWLDSNIHTSNDCLETRKYLGRIFSHLIVFDEEDVCKEFISLKRPEKIFLIVSGKLGATIVPIIHDLEQIESIYIFCEDKVTHEQWAKDYHKVRGVFNDSSFLLSKLCLTVTSRFNNSNPISIFNTVASKEKTIRHLNKQSTVFMWFQLSLEVLLRMPATEKAKYEMLTFCRSIYRNNDKELETIDLFEEYYCSSQAIYWYTCDCFMYRLLNKLLRTENIDLIYTFRYFIKDLHDTIQRLHSKDIEASPLTVYRGQRMSVVELEELKENVHQLIAMNTFLSTTLQKSVALMYAGNSMECPYVEAVLFEIDISTADGLKSKPFANISAHSHFDTEDEILFSIGAIFQIDSVDQLDNGLWIVQLHLTSIEDKQLALLSDFMTKSLGKETTLLDLGIVLLNMGEDDKAIQYLKTFLEEQPTAHEDIAYVHMQLGHIYSNRYDYELALFHYEIALDYQRESLPPHFIGLPQIYENIGYVNEKMGHSQIALKYYQQQLQLYLACPEPSEDLIMKVERKLSVLYNDSDHSKEKELDYNNRRLELYSQLRPANHTDFIQIYFDIAFASSHAKDHMNAVINYAKALEICSSTLPPNHDQTKIAYYNLAYCQFQNGEYEKSLTNFEATLQLELTCQSPKLLFIAKIFNGCGHVHFRRKDWNNAIQSYKKAVEICSRTSTPHSTYCRNLGYVYLECGDHEKAIEALENALQIERNSSSPSEATTIIELHISIGHGYYAREDYNHAINYYQAALNAYRHVLPVHSTKNEVDQCSNQLSAQNLKIFVGTCFSLSNETGNTNELISAANQSYDDLNITDLCQNFIRTCIDNRQYEDALTFSRKIIDIELNYPSKNKTNLILVYSYTARIYQFWLNKHDEALRLFQEILAIELKQQPIVQVSIASVYNNIGMLYCAMEQYDTAIASFKSAIDVLEPHSTAQMESFLTYIENLRFTYSKCTIFDEEIEYLLKLLLSEFPWNSTDWQSLPGMYSLTAFNNLKPNNYQISIENWEKQVEILLASSSVNNSSLTETYVNLAEASSKDKNDIQALKYYERALESEQRLDAPRDAWMLFIHYFIRNIYFAQGKYELSITHFLQATHCQNAINGSDHAICFDSLGYAFKMIKRYDDAIENYTKALQIKLQYLPSKLLAIAQSYANIGNVHFKKKNYQVSIGMYQKAIETALLIDPVPESLISWYGDLSEVYYTSNNLEEAELSCESAIYKGTFVSNLNPLVTSDIYSYLSTINYIKHDYVAALSWDRKALKIRLEHALVNDVTTGVVFNDIGKALYYMNLFDESLMHFRKAIDVFSNSTPVDSFQTANTCRNLGQLFAKTHQFSEAAENFEKSTELLLVQRPLEPDFHLLYIKGLPAPTNVYVSKCLVIMRNLTKMELQ